LGPVSCPHRRRRVRHTSLLSYCPPIHSRARWFRLRMEQYSFISSVLTFVGTVAMAEMFGRSFPPSGFSSESPCIRKHTSRPSRGSCRLHRPALHLRDGRAGQEVVPVGLALFGLGYEVAVGVLVVAGPLYPGAAPGILVGEAGVVAQGLTPARRRRGCWRTPRSSPGLFSTRFRFFTPVVSIPRM
jgi:hypothetical protein